MDYIPQIYFGGCIVFFIVWMIVHFELSYRGISGEDNNMDDFIFMTPLWPIVVVAFIFIGLFVLLEKLYLKVRHKFDTKRNT